MGEDMKEGAPVRPQPARIAAQQRTPVGHMLETFRPTRCDRAQGRRIEVVHVGGVHGQIREPPLRRLGLVEGALAVGVRHGGDARGRIGLRHEQRQRAPSASKLENALSVREAGVARGLFEGAKLGLRERRFG